MSGPPAPRLVRTLVCSYSRDELPTAWLRVFHRLEHAMARAGLRVRVRLLPLEDLPEEVDVLVVPPELVDRARAARAGARVIATTRQHVAVTAVELTRDLESGREIYAERVKPGEPEVRVHRGTGIL
jgi:hypothetical protein